MRDGEFDLHKSQSELLLPSNTINDVEIQMRQDSQIQSQMELEAHKMIPCLSYMDWEDQIEDRPLSF